MALNLWLWMNKSVLGIFVQKIRWIVGLGLQSFKFRSNQLYTRHVAYSHTGPWSAGLETLVSLWWISAQVVPSGLSRREKTQAVWSQMFCVTLIFAFSCLQVVTRLKRVLSFKNKAWSSGVHYNIHEKDMLFDQHTDMLGLQVLRCLLRCPWHVRGLHGIAVMPVRSGSSNTTFEAFKASKHRCFVIFCKLQCSMYTSKHSHSSSPVMLYSHLVSYVMAWTVNTA